MPISTKNNSHFRFWIMYLVVVGVCILFLEWGHAVKKWNGLDQAKLIWKTQASLVGGLFLFLYPLRKVMGSRYEVAKVPISLVFLTIHFILSLFLIAFFYKREGSLSPGFLFSFALFFLIFFGVLLFGIFSILRPISKST